MKIKLLFVSHNFIFLHDVISLFQQDPDFEVKVDRWEHRWPNENSPSLLNWADVIIVNYVLAPAVWYSKHKKPHQTLIIRHHRFELETRHPKMLNVPNIDKMVFTSRIFKPAMEEMIGLSKQQSAVIFNPIQVQRFQLEKKEGSEFHLGMLGYARKIKRPDRAFEIFEKLRQHDSRYKLFFKGPTVEENPVASNATKSMIENLHQRINSSSFQDSVFFDKAGPDVPEWFQNIGFILSTSEFESFHCATAEGMASGSIPMIAGWNGAHHIYPQEFISTDLDEIVQKILSYSRNKELFQRKQREAIDYCLKHFSHDVIYKQFRQLVLECVSQKRKIESKSQMATRRKRVSRAPSIKPRSSKARLRKQVTRGRPMRRKKRRTR